MDLIPTDVGSNVGEMIREARQVKGWTRADLAKLYGGFFHDERISEDTIRMWEDYNKVPKKSKRRYVLSLLLDIPLAAIGVSPVLDAIASLDKLDSDKIDISAARIRLRGYQQQNHSTTVGHMLEDIINMIHDIHDEVPYSSTRQREQLLTLLCDYQQFIAGLFRDHSRYSEALHYQNKAYAVAKSLKKNEVTTLVLWRRGITYHEQGDLEAAESDLREALSLRPNSPQLEGVIRSCLGHVLAHASTDQKAINEAFTMLDSAGNLLEASKKVPDPHFIRFNEEGWHLNRASAWLGISNTRLRSSDKAFQELSVVPGSKNRKRRYAYSTYLQARGWFEEREFPMATKLALDALKVAEEIQSKVNIDRIDVLHQDLKATSYGKSTNVAALGAQVFKVKHPQLFA